MHHLKIPHQSPKIISIHVIENNPRIFLVIVLKLAIDMKVMNYYATSTTCLLIVSIKIYTTTNWKKCHDWVLRFFRTVPSQSIFSRSRVHSERSHGLVLWKINAVVGPPKNQIKTSLWDNSMVFSLVKHSAGVQYYPLIFV